MRILFVAMSNSIHVQRWISQISDQGWDIHLFPSKKIDAHHPDLQQVTIHRWFHTQDKSLHPSVQIQGMYIPHLIQLDKLAWFIRSRFQKDDYAVEALEKVIRKTQPDIIHSMEFQKAGYLALQVQERMGDDFPTWIATNYGSDVYLFGRLAEHRERVHKILQRIDYYDCECKRDIRLAKEMGLTGEPLPVYPNSSGFDLTYVSQFRAAGAVANRRFIMLKGYQHFAGRALIGLQAVQMCAEDILSGGYTVVIYSSTPDVRIAAELMEQNTGIPFKILPRTEHDVILQHFGQARVYLGLSISDAISTSMLEAMVMGAFPIQSNTACADEWLTDGESGFIVPPEEPAVIAEAICKALQDDNLVNHAADQNWQVAEKRLDEQKIKPKIIALYQHVIDNLNH